MAKALGTGGVHEATKVWEDCTLMFFVEGCLGVHFRGYRQLSRGMLSFFIFCSLSWPNPVDLQLGEAHEIGLSFVSGS